MSTINPEELTGEIMKTLKEWAEVTEDAAFRGVYETAKEAERKLHAAHPAEAPYYNSWDEYNAGWTVHHDLSKKKKGATMIVHNATHYQLAHLLEYGHALHQGGRARAFPHIAPVAEEAEDDLLDNIKKYIQQS